MLSIIKVLHLNHSISLCYRKLFPFLSPYYFIAACTIFVLYGKKYVPPKRDPAFKKVGLLFRWGNLFSHKQIWFFNRLLLIGEISLNRGPYFSKMFFLHINTPSISTKCVTVKVAFPLSVLHVGVDN